MLAYTFVRKFPQSQGTLDKIVGKGDIHMNQELNDVSLLKVRGQILGGGAMTRQGKGKRLQRGDTVLALKG